MNKKQKRLFWRCSTAATWHGLGSCKLITLTSSEEAGNMTPAFNRMVKLIRARGQHLAEYHKKEKYKKFEYLATEEKGADTGMLHLHMIAFCEDIPQRCLSAAWEAIHKSPIVWIERCWASADAARYAIKYAAKAPNGRTRISRNFTPAGASELWRSIKQAASDLKQRLALFYEALKQLARSKTNCSTTLQVKLCQLITPKPLDIGACREHEKSELDRSPRVRFLENACNEMKNTEKDREGQRKKEINRAIREITKAIERIDLEKKRAGVRDKVTHWAWKDFV